MARLLTPTSIAALSLVALGLPVLAQETDQKLRGEIDAALKALEVD